jgi:glycosyltransferase involved in cell wall biosynthesis
MSTLRIAFITPEFVTESYFSGGLANYVYRVSKELVSLGHDVHVYRLTATFPPQWMNRLTRHRLSNTLRWIGFSFKAYQKLRNLHRQKAFHIVQFSNSYACGLFTMLLLWVHYVVRISCYRPVWNEMAGVVRNFDARAIEWLEKLQLRLSRHIYAPSFALKKMLVHKAKIRHVEVIRTPLYVETADWDTSIYNEYLKDKDYLLFFGRFQLHKGFHILAQALHQILQDHNDLYAVCVGLDMSTTIAPSMKEYARSLCNQNADRLIFINQTPHAQLYPIIAGAKLVVLPSLVDNLPNTCLEAMAFGKPVIGTIGTSFDELITDGESGFLVPPGDVKSLSLKIKAAWIHPDLDKIGQAAQRKIQEFAPEYTVQALLHYYNEIIKSYDD